MKKSQTRWDIIKGLRIFTRFWPESSPGQEPAWKNVDALVLVHGLGVSSRYMVPIAQQMAGPVPVYAPDLPGFGRSQHPEQVFTIRQHAQALCDWMDIMGLNRAVLLGNSIGCQVAARFALQYPDRVDRMVLTGPTVDPRFRSYLKIIARGMMALLFEPLSLYPILLSGYFAAGPREMAVVLGYALDDPMEAYLPGVKMPVMVVRGQKDWIASQKWVNEMAALLPDGRAEVIAGGAHASNYDSPAALARLMHDFISSAGKQNTQAILSG